MRYGKVQLQDFATITLEKSIPCNLRSKNLLMLPQTNTIKYENDSIIFEGASNGITFQMKLKAKPPSALLRNV